MIKKSDVNSRLIDHFSRLIAKKVFAPGCKLPPERLLAKRLGVSRSSLRHALKGLESMGVVVQRVGDGTYLRPDGSAILARPMDFLLLLEDISLKELYELRLIVEPELSALAAERATLEQLAVIERALRSMKKATNKAEYARQDLEFHEAIFRASGNRAGALIFSMFRRAFRRGLSRTLTLAYESPLGMKGGIMNHAAIFSAIQRKRPREARRSTVELIIEARDRLLRENQSRMETELTERITPLGRN